MKVVVCGAGQVGSNIARYLAAEDNDVTIIDQNAALVQSLGESADLRGVVGHASSPDVLEQAGAGDADMLVAVTYADEVNMVACQVAHSLFSVPDTIARIRAQTYLKPRWHALFAKGALPIDVVISPEIEVARAVARRLQVPGAFDMTPLADGRVILLGILCGAACPVLNTPLRLLTALFPDLTLEVVAILRADRLIVPSADDVMLAGDEVYVVVDARHLTRVMTAFGHDEAVARRVVLVGGGNIGLFLAQELEEKHPGVAVHLIEMNRVRAELCAQALTRTEVICGDALEVDILKEARADIAEAVITVSNDDETNILVSLLAKRQGTQRAITLINKPSYSPLVTQLGVDAVVSPRAITVSSILQHVRRGRIKSVHSLRDGVAEVIELEALDTSALTNLPLREIKFPPGVLVGAIVRGDQVIAPRPDSVIRPKDRVVILAHHDQVKKVERLFAVRLEFF